MYSTVEGISFYANGSFSLNLVEADEDNALFNSDDVDLIMKRGITGMDLCYFLSRSRLT